MYLKHYLNEKGERVYTLKVSILALREKCRFFILKKYTYNFLFLI